MYRGDRICTDDCEVFYSRLQEQLRGLLAEETDWTANLANAAALLFYQLEDVNWLGFYLLRDGELVLGPFQGKPACTRIAVGEGVCGAAVEEGESQVVSDVHEFPGHIACDEDSRSELVIPMYLEGEILGVLDIDSPELERFDEQDERAMRELAEMIVHSSQ